MALFWINLIELKVECNTKLEREAVRDFGRELEQVPKGLQEPRFFSLYIWLTCDLWSLW